MTRSEPVVGERITTLEVTPTSRQLVQYAAATKDFYEIHYDRVYALEHGLPGVISHGLFKLAIMGRAVTTWAGPECFVREISATYRGVDLVDKPFRVEGTVVSVDQDSGLSVVSIDLQGISAEGVTSTIGRCVVDVPSA